MDLVQSHLSPTKLCGKVYICVRTLFGDYFQEITLLKTLNHLARKDE